MDNAEFAKARNQIISAAITKSKMKNYQNTFSVLVNEENARSPNYDRRESSKIGFAKKFHVAVAFACHPAFGEPFENRMIVLKEIDGPTSTGSFVESVSVCARQFVR